MPVDDDPQEYIEDDGRDRVCWRCDGEGCGIVGTDWDCEDGVNGPYDGEVQECRCCGGTGDAKDCTYW